MVPLGLTGNYSILFHLRDGPAINFNLGLWKIEILDFHIATSSIEFSFSVCVPHSYCRASDTFEVCTRLIITSIPLCFTSFRNSHSLIHGVNGYLIPRHHFSPTVTEALFENISSFVMT